MQKSDDEATVGEEPLTLDTLRAAYMAATGRTEEEAGAAISEALADWRMNERELLALVGRLTRGGRVRPVEVVAWLHVTRHIETVPDGAALLVLAGFRAGQRAEWAARAPRH